MTSDEKAATDARLNISFGDDLRGAISIGNPNPIKSGPIVLAPPIVLINLVDIAAL